MEGLFNTNIVSGYTHHYVQVLIDHYENLIDESDIYSKACLKNLTKYKHFFICLYFLYHDMATDGKWQTL